MRQLADHIILAMGLLTRLPLPSRRVEPESSSTAVWAWPIVGALVGGIGAIVGAASIAIGLTPWIAAVLALIAMALATGGLHEDGLADSADGLWGGQNRARRLEIMRDSRVGAYGVLALGLTLLLRFAAVAAISEAGAWLALVGAAAFGRSGMAVLMAFLPTARQDGLSHATGRPSGTNVLVAVVIGIVLAAVTGPGLLGVHLAAAMLVWLGWQAQHKLGGQTGDILGAGCLLAETAALIAAI
ncbi:MAG: adenosylcobinamide-GDP ribazoletransferase [Pseudomonadota bacterium]